MMIAVPFLALLLAHPAPASPCSRDATVKTIVTPDYPDSARAAHLGLRETTVSVDIRADGTVQGVRVVKSSGNDALDQATIAAATQSTYLPKVVNCKAVAGAYLFKVTFDPGSPKTAEPNPGATMDPCNHPARATYAAPAVYPRGHYTNKPVPVVVKIDITTDGTIDGGGVVKSSGDAAFDGAAIEAAELSRFEPKVVNCHPVAATYLFKVTFLPH